MMSTQTAEMSTTTDSSTRQCLKRVLLHTKYPWQKKAYHLKPMSNDNFFPNILIPQSIII